MRRHCPACSSAAVEEFTTLRQLPVHGQSVFSNQQDALDLARADQVLTVCADCGFVFNATYDPELLDYSGQHEESQAFSPTFRAFASELAAGWVDRYDLRRELVLEVGCGKGDFLGFLVGAGAGRAHGVDPGLDLARLPGSGAVTGEVARFAPSDLSRSARALVCRHTLEHVPDVADFLAQVVSGVDPTLCRALLIEVPDLGRVLDEGAFWDLQYEHCSSFTATSLLGLFQRQGLDVVDLRLVYAGQYLVVEADPLQGRSAVPELAVPEPADVVRRCHGFARAVDAQLERWSAWFGAEQAAGREAVVWGGGAKGQVFLNALPGSGVARVVDINKGLHGGWMGGVGLPIVAPDSLRRDPPDSVVLMNGIYLEEVRSMLDGLGLQAVALQAV